MLKTQRFCAMVSSSLISNFQVSRFQTLWQCYYVHYNVMYPLDASCGYKYNIDTEDQGFCHIFDKKINLLFHLLNKSKFSEITHCVAIVMFIPFY